MTSQTTTPETSAFETATPGTTTSGSIDPAARLAQNRRPLAQLALDGYARQQLTQEAERFRRGDDCALRYAYDQFGPAVYRLARGGLPTAADAEEVAQSTFVAAWLNRDTFDPDRGSLLGWILGIARRQVIDRHRARAREQRVAKTLGAQPLTPVTATDPDSVIDRLLITDGLARLPSEQRRVLELAFFDDLTHQQVSDRTGIPLGTVKSHIRRGMAALKQHWEQARP